MQGRDDVAGFIAGFAGDDRFVVDYLVEEVLQRQPEQVRSFLLQTSVLGRLTRPAVRRRHRSGRRQGACWRRSSGGTSSWSRSTTAAGGTATTTCSATCCGRACSTSSPTSSPRCNVRASDWYERNGDRPRRSDHALAAEDFERAADLVELAHPGDAPGRQEATLRRWLEALPDELFRVRPVLSVGYVGALMSTRRGPRASRRGCGTPSGGWTPTTGRRDRTVRRRWWSWTTTRSAGSPPRSPCTAPGWPCVARRRGRHPDARPAGARARRRRRPPRPWRGRRACIGLASLERPGTSRRRTAGTPTAWRALGRAGHRSDVVGGAITLADIRIAQGRLARGDELLRARTAGRHRDRPRPCCAGAADMHVGMSRAAPRAQRPATPPASTCRPATELGEHAGLPQNPYRWRVGDGPAAADRRRLAGALELLDEAERVYDD